MKVIVPPIGYLECPPEEMKIAADLLRETPVIQRALQELLSQYMGYKLAIPAKELAKEDVRLAVAYTDGFIEAVQAVLRGEIHTTAVSTPTSNED